MTFHAEATSLPVELARTPALDRRPRRHRAQAGHTRRADYLELLPEFDQVLVMTVEPGFGGQQFMESTMPKLEKLRAAVDATGLDVWLQVDGGVDERTITIAREHGADTFVAGSACSVASPRSRSRCSGRPPSSTGIDAG